MSFDNPTIPPQKAPFENSTSIEDLLSEHSHLAGKVWQGHQNNRSKSANNEITTGYSELDQLLGGWQLGTTTELGLQSNGIGELRLLTPAITYLQNRPIGAKNVICINPPLTPFAPTLVQLGINLKRLTFVKTRNLSDLLWTCEQMLISGAVAATISWTGRANLSNGQMRRLQLAAEKFNGLNVLLRHHSCLEQPSVSSVRLSLSMDSFSRLNVNVKKQVGRWRNQHCTVSLKPHYEKWQMQAVELWPVPNHQQRQRENPKLELVREVRHRALTVISAKRILAVV